MGLGPKAYSRLSPKSQSPIPSTRHRRRRRDDGGAPIRGGGGRVGHRGPPAMSAAASGERDELADSLAELFTNVSLMVRGELQGTNSQLSLLEKMNRRVAEEYNNYGDVASGLRVFVEQLNEKNQSFGEYVSQIDAIDQQVTEFEAVVSMLDKHVSLLEKKVKSAYNIAPTQ
uniref:Biogenesis of lysosome-related organelles complex 1 subunit 2 n=1 Tax=Oryza barthii TaxID=65489 RepID=A0A0D3F1U9_9ORYZ